MHLPPEHRRALFGIRYAGFSIHPADHQVRVARHLPEAWLLRRPENCEADRVPLFLKQHGLRFFLAINQNK